MTQFQKFMQLTKVDVAKRHIIGVFTAEQVDKSGEVADYPSTKKAIQDWSLEINKASKGKSKGNIRKMHNKEACGKVISIDFDDANKVISGCVEVDEKTIDEAEKGILNGFSIGGAYVKKWECPVFKGAMRFTPVIAEISVVDNPCVPDAIFDAIKDAEFAVLKDGQEVMHKFAAKELEAEQEQLDLEMVFKAKDGSIHKTKEEAVAKNAALVAADAVSPIEKTLKKIDDLFAEKEESVEKSLEFVDGFDKGMYNIARLATIIDDLGWLCESVKWEERSEGDTGSQNPNSLRSSVDALCASLRTMVSEETREMAASMEMDATPKELEALNKVTGKQFVAKAKDNDDLAKAIAERDALKKSLDDLGTKLEAKFDEISKRLKVIEDQPAGGGSQLFIVEKDKDSREQVSVTTKGMSPQEYRQTINRT